MRNGSRPQKGHWGGGLWVVLACLDSHDDSGYLPKRNSSGAHTIASVVLEDLDLDDSTMPLETSPKFLGSDVGRQANNLEA